MGIKQYVSYYNGAISRVDVSELATKTNDGLMSKEDKAKLDSIDVGATASPNASSIVQDEMHRFVTDEQIAKWNNGSVIQNGDGTIGNATGTASGLMSAADKAKLDAIEDGATKYIHPDTHNASMIVTDSNNRFVSDAEKTAWNAKADKTLATTTNAGLMSAADKAKLDSINNISADNIVQDAEHKFVTETQLVKLESLPEKVASDIVIEFDDSTDTVVIGAQCAQLL